MIARIWKGVVRRDDIDAAVYYPDECYLLERDATVSHSEVVDQT